MFHKPTFNYRNFMSLGVPRDGEMHQLGLCKDEAFDAVYLDALLEGRVAFPHPGKMPASWPPELLAMAKLLCTTRNNNGSSDWNKHRSRISELIGMRHNNEPGYNTLWFDRFIDFLIEEIAHEYYFGGEHRMELVAELQALKHNQEVFISFASSNQRPSACKATKDAYQHTADALQCTQIYVANETVKMSNKRCA